MNWRIKAAVQKCVGHLPLSTRINRGLQHLNGSAALTEEYCLKKWLGTTALVAQARVAIGRETFGGVALEVGTGWHPIASLALLNAGFSEVRTYDLVRLASDGNVRAAITMLLSLGDRQEIEIDGAVASTMRSALSVPAQRRADAILRRLNIHYEIGDVSKIGQPSVDLFMSLSTLEHVPPSALVEMFNRFRLISVEGGVMAHVIDLGDHFSQQDTSITKYNFLRFSDFAWRRISSPLNYQNRLRASDYLQLTETAGWIPVDTHVVRKSLEQLATVPLHADFQTKSTEDLAITYISGIWQRRGNHHSL